MSDRQSPIDLGVAVEGLTPHLTIDYQMSVMHGNDTHFTLEFPVAGGSSIRYGEHRYELEQFHFHTPSEHVVNGVQSAAEAHFVHSDGEGNAAVVAVFIAEVAGAKGPMSIERAMSMSILLPQSTRHFSYIGSLTQPPFTEGIQWIVLVEPVMLPPEWLDSFRSRFGNSARDLKPVGERSVVLGPSVDG